MDTKSAPNKSVRLDHNLLKNLAMLIFQSYPHHSHSADAVNVIDGGTAGINMIANPKGWGSLSKTSIFVANAQTAGIFINDQKTKRTTVTMIIAHHGTDSGDSPCFILRMEGPSLTPTTMTWSAAKRPAIVIQLL